ncbi:MFS transporter [Streptomyces atratus]|uniref:MFS transporter n=1 Tax=Streptomyces atratus TaxID=1893 RepID=UPI003669A233
MAAVLVLAGAAQALANPATNRLIADLLPPLRRAAAVGMKQSGVQFGAFAAGLLLPTLAAATSWRIALAVVSPLALIALVLALRLPPDRQPDSADKRLTLPGRPNVPARWLIVYSLGVGMALASLNTYLPLFAHEKLDFGERTSGALIAAVGAAGVLARIGWTRISGRLSDISTPLVLLAATAACFVLLMPAAEVWPPLVWAGAIGLGGSAAAANAVSMVAVVRSTSFGATGHASALVSMGFFGGFVLGPTTFGQLADSPAGYSAGWAMTGLSFAVSVLAGLQVRRTVNR